VARVVAKVVVEIAMTARRRATGATRKTVHRNEFESL
jgi:histone H3/H4